MAKKTKVVIVMPAYHAEKTLEKTFFDIPSEYRKDVILVDDASKDKTVKIAKKLGIRVFTHKKNLGYGANQKTCYSRALKDNADIVVMVHPDYQYDPKFIPDIIEPIKNNEAEIVLGSRFLFKNVVKMGMPRWKYFGNRLFTIMENLVLGLKLSEYHTGYRAYSSMYLKKCPFQLFSDKFVFDQELLAHAAANKIMIKEVAIPTKYFKEASSIKILDSFFYGLNILSLLMRYVLHKSGIKKSKRFEFLP